MIISEYYKTGVQSGCGELLLIISEKLSWAFTTTSRHFGHTLTQWKLLLLFRLKWSSIRKNRRYNLKNVNLFLNILHWFTKMLIFPSLDFSINQTFSNCSCTATIIQENPEFPGSNQGSWSWLYSTTCGRKLESFLHHSNKAMFVQIFKSSAPEAVSNYCPIVIQPSLA